MLKNLKVEPYESTGSSGKLVPGGYVCRIIGVREDGDRLVVAYDIEEGPFKGYFKARHDRDIQRDPGAKWKGTYTIWETDYNDKGKASAALNGFAGALEHSNSGFSYDSAVENFSLFKGRLIGLLMRDEEYNGYAYVKPYIAVGAGRVRNGEYTINQKKGTPHSDVNGFTDDQGFTPATKDEQDDGLPF